MPEKKNKLKTNIDKSTEAVVSFIELMKETKKLTKGVKTPLGKSLPWVVALVAVSIFVVLQMLEDGVF